MGTKRPLKVLEEYTSGKSFTCHRYCFEEHSAPEARDDDRSSTFEVLDAGETHLERRVKNLRPLADKIWSLGNRPIFRYFLDGSRRTYKVDDIQYDKRIFPILAGQIGAACCERRARDSFAPVPSATKFKVILSVPSFADANGPRDEFFCDLRNEINSQLGEKGRFFQIDDVIPYDDNKHDTEGLAYENIAIATIHEHMLELEKRAVHVLANETRKIREDRYLLKDGSLEYARSRVGEFTDLSVIRNNFRFVVGVSKTFNAEHCVDEKKQTNASRVAGLKTGFRTPAFKFRSERSRGEQGAVYFVAWYLRLRDMRHTVSPFDGVVKVELILAGDNPYDDLIETEEIDQISANLLLESLPTCYGNDSRWANHLYPVYLTERFLKAKFVSDSVLINLL